MKKKFGIVTDHNSIKLSWTNGHIQINISQLILDQYKFGSMILRCRFRHVVTRTCFRECVLRIRRLEVWMTTLDEPLPSLDKEECDTEHYYNAAYLPDLERVEGYIHQFLQASRVYIRELVVYHGPHRMSAKRLCIRRDKHNQVYLGIEKIRGIVDLDAFLTNVTNVTKANKSKSTCPIESESTPPPSTIYRIRIHHLELHDPTLLLGIHVVNIGGSTHRMNIEFARIFTDQRTIGICRRIYFDSTHIDIHTIQLSISQETLHTLDRLVKGVKSWDLGASIIESSPIQTAPVIEDYISKRREGDARSKITPPTLSTCPSLLNFTIQSDYFAECHENTLCRTIISDIKIQCIHVRLHNIKDEPCLILSGYRLRYINYLENKLKTHYRVGKCVLRDCRNRKKTTDVKNTGSPPYAFYSHSTPFISLETRVESTLYGDPIHSSAINIGNSILNLDEGLLHEMTPPLLELQTQINSIVSLLPERVTYFKDTRVQGFDMKVSYIPRGLHLGKLFQGELREILQLSRIKESPLCFSRFSMESCFSYRDMFQKMSKIWESQLVAQGSTLLYHLGFFKRLRSVGRKVIGSI